MRATSIPLALTLALASGIALLAASTALAQPAPPTSPEVIQKVYACAAVTDATARLACYDATVGALKSAENQGQFAAVDAPGVRRMEREAFGFSMPSLPHLGLPGFTRGSAGAALGPTEEVAMTIQRVGHMDGRIAYVMENGQTWLAIDGSAENRRARAGAAVKVSRAALGSYMMEVLGGGAALRVHRLE